MSQNVAYAGFSLKLNEELQTDNSLKKIAKSLGYVWTNNDGWDEIMFNEKDNMNRWKPHMDYDGKYGVIWVTHYEYDAFDLEYKQPITAMGVALKDFIDQTMIMPKEQINAFAQIYYNGSDDPFKF